METKTQKTKVIFVNKTQVRVEEEKLLGKEILRLAGFDFQQYDLFLKDGPINKKIEPNDTVDIKNGLHFNAIRREVPYG